MTKKSGRILVSEAYMRDWGHIGVNSGLLEVIQDVYPNYQIHYFGEENHNRVLKKYVKGVNFHTVWFPRLINIFLLPLFDIIYSHILLSTLFRSKKQDRILITNRLPLSHLIYNVLNLFMHRKTFMVLHGQMENLVNPTKTNFTKYYFYLEKIGFGLSGKHTKYITLGESIKNNIILNKILKPIKIINIDHPYNYTSSIISSSLELPLRIGFVGRAAKRKNTQQIFQLGRLLSQEVNEKKIIIEIIGKWDPAIFPYSNEYVLFSSQDALYSDEEYAKKITQLHYICCFFDSTIYKATPSGTFFDVIKFERPLLMLKGNDFMDFYANRFPSIAGSYDSCNDMANHIKELLNNIELYKDNYSIQIEAIKKAKEQLSIHNIAKIFKSQLAEDWY
jgi:hypothetical protein